MHFAFRADASLQIGTGHVMRCLTLADALRERGAKSTFFCRSHVGHLLDLIQDRGHSALALSSVDGGLKIIEDRMHSNWLGTNWSNDAEEMKQALGDQEVDWLVVDHYALDIRWEQALRLYTRHIMVIDDLADRQHDCDLLLDQTFKRQKFDYMPLVPEGCQLLCGAQFALLRPEFAKLREYSLKRRAQPHLKELLITMGGVDLDNVTEAVLRALRNCSLPEGCRLTVVMGSTAPWLKDILDLARSMPMPTRVLVGVSNMAKLMAESDLVIGASGTTAWERCALGVPSISLAVAENQRLILSELQKHGATVAIDYSAMKDFSNAMRDALLHLCATDSVKRMIKQASLVTEGNGVEIVEAIIYR
jgi:UDP-2,4-diacetamido-2,4,6-trideoxy-beta-L-altropyranose hydrolase